MKRWKLVGCIGMYKQGLSARRVDDVEKDARDVERDLYTWKAWKAV